MQKQGPKLYAALVLLVESLRQPDELQRILRPLGKKHIGYGATAEHYPMVGNALMHALEKFLPDHWTPELGAAWANTLKEVTDIMLDGAGMTAQARPVPEEAAGSLPSPVSG